MTRAGGDPSQPGKLPEGTKQDRTGSDCPLERPVLATMSKVLLRLAEGEEPAAGILWTGTAELGPGTQKGHAQAQTATGMWSWRTLRPQGPAEPRSESLTSDPYQPNPVCSEQRPVPGRGADISREGEPRPGLAAPWDPDPSPAFRQALGSGESGAPHRPDERLQRGRQGSPRAVRAPGRARGPLLPHGRAPAPHLAEAGARVSAFVNSRDSKRAAVAGPGAGAERERGGQRAVSL